MRADSHAVAATDAAKEGLLGALRFTVDNADTEILADLNAQTAAVTEIRGKMQLRCLMGSGCRDGHLSIT